MADVAPSGVRYQRFDVPPGVVPQDRVDFWRTWYLETVDAPVRLDPVTPPTPPDFRLRVEVLTVGDVSIVDLHGGPAASSRPRSTTESTDLLRFSLLYRAPCTQVHVHDRDLALADAAVLLTGRTSGRSGTPAGTRQIQVAVPRAVLPFPDATIEQVVQRPLAPGIPVLDALVRPMMGGMVGRLEELSRTVGEELGRTWMSMISMLVRALAERPVDDATAATRLVRIRRFIEANLADPDLGPDMIAAAMHLSRRSLYLLLAGDGVAGMIRHARLRRAAAMLRDPCRRHLTVAEIGAAVGLPRSAHFSRLAAPPRELRAEHDRTLRSRGSALPEDGSATPPGRAS